MEISFFGLFLIICFIGSIVLFYLEGFKKDSDGRSIGDWVYQLLYFLFSIFTFSMLVIFSFFMIGNDFNMGLDHDNIVLDDVDLNNLNFVGSETYTSSTIFFVFPFENIDSDKENTLLNSDFCFYYNNTDGGANVVRVVNAVTEISDFIYLANETFGFECIHINSTYVKKNAVLGLTCLDCSVPNPLDIPEINTTVEVKEIHITNNDPTTYSIEVENKTHVFWLETNNNVGWIVKDWFFLIYLLGLSGFILAFGFRWGYKYVSEDYSETF